MPALQGTPIAEKAVGQSGLYLQSIRVVPRVNETRPSFGTGYLFKEVVWQKKEMFLRNWTESGKQV